MSSRTIVHLTRPRITRAFNVQVVGEGAASAEMTGMEIAAVQMLLRVASGAPRFDLEFNGRMFRRCALAAIRSDDTIRFTFEVASRAPV